MQKKKTYKPKRKAPEVNEPQVDYGNSINISTLADLEERQRQHSRNMSHDQRMAYLQKLISITYSDDDLLRLTRKFNEGRIKTRNKE